MAIMNRRLGLGALLLGLCIAGSSSAVAHPGETYVFGGGMVFDTNRNMAMYGPLSQIVYAYRSSFEVIGRVLSSSRAGLISPRVFLLGERERPNSIIGYDPMRGVEVIVRYEGTPVRNLLAELKAAEARGRLQEAYDALPLHNRMPLITFAPLFRCGQPR